jgi:hypothetical protein
MNAVTSLIARWHQPRPATTSVLRLAGFAGAGAALTYIGATVAGSVLDPLYSQIRQHVSDLTATGASTWAPLAPAYLAYNALVVGFAGTLYLASPRTGTWKIGTGLSAINAFAGVMMVTLFREDLGGVPTTAAGAGHLAFAGVSSLAIVATAVTYGIAFRRSPVWRPLAIFSFATAVGFGVLGPLAAIATAQGSAMAGLAERGPIGLFMLWLLVVGSYALVINGRPQVATPAR